MPSDIRTRLMSAAALLTSAPPSTTEWETVELPTDVMESSRWEQARTRATRCMQLLEQLAGMVSPRAYYSVGCSREE